MRQSPLILTAALLASALMLSACGNEKETQPVSASPGAATAAAGLPASASAMTKAGTEALPENLPKDFPLPADASISTSHSGTADGKKSALLVFTTKESMETVIKLYKDYFNAKLGSDAAQTIDDKNLIIQGNTKDNKQSWSVIGGRLASREGVIELTVTWAES
ncbi:hypothetical protein [Paenibacillus sp. YN15]|uniref:hypothetical protein n=1 Tax=Paenibacillus sp. YN15 TaxID=1742774 RepID=UPI000DCDE165|nr:hypothetical protein [Paenibacillus sp. YN15]RAU92605.1 hypothetical protein DQG13_27335 [Paenibacillus sp. YN15]